MHHILGILLHTYHAPCLIKAVAHSSQIANGQYKEYLIGKITKRRVERTLGAFLVESLPASLGLCTQRYRSLKKPHCKSASLILAPFSPSSALSAVISVLGHLFWVTLVVLLLLFWISLLLREKWAKI